MRGRIRLCVFWVIMADTHTHGALGFGRIGIRELSFPLTYTYMYMYIIHIILQSITSTNFKSEGDREREREKSTLMYIIVYIYIYIYWVCSNAMMIALERSQSYPFHHSIPSSSSIIITPPIKSPSFITAHLHTHTHTHTILSPHSITHVHDSFMRCSLVPPRVHIWAPPSFFPPTLYQVHDKCSKTRHP